MSDNGIGAAKEIGDVVSAGVVVGTLAQVLPSIAAVLSIVWTLIRIAESKTVRDLVRRLRNQPLD